MTLTVKQVEWLGKKLTDLKEKYGIEETEQVQYVAGSIKQQWTVYGLMTLGAHNIKAFNEGFGGLIFEANILPFDKNGVRGEKPQSMLVMTEYTPSDDYTIYVINNKGSVHFKKDNVYFPELQMLALALDYNGQEILNPRYA